MRRVALLLPSFMVVLACRPAAHRGDDHLASAVVADSAQPLVVACMDAVLAGSPMVERFVSRHYVNSRARWVALRNPPSERATGVGFAIEPKQGTPRQFVLFFPWPRPYRGTGMVTPIDPKISDMEGEALTDMGSSLLREIRAQCTPMSPGEISCSRVEQGRNQRCVAGI